MNASMLTRNISSATDTRSSNCQRTRAARSNTGGRTNLQQSAIPAPFAMTTASQEESSPIQQHLNKSPKGGRGKILGQNVRAHLLRRNQHQHNLTTRNALTHIVMLHMNVKRLPSNLRSDGQTTSCRTINVQTRRGLNRPAQLRNQPT